MTITLVLVTWMGVSVAAYADPGFTVNRDRDSATAKIVETRRRAQMEGKPRQESPSDAAVPVGSGGGGSQVPRFMMEVFRGSPGDDDACVDTIYPTTASFAGASSSVFWAIDAQINDHTDITGAPPPNCNADDPDNPPPAGPTGPELLLAAEQFIDTLVPPPGLTTQPPRNEGFVGVPVLVQLGHDHVIDAPARTVTLFGTSYTLSARLTADTTIDWGNGETDGGVTRPGATYEQVDGDLDDHRLIRHVYIDRGPVTITATDTWTVELNLQGVGTNTVTGITLTEATDIDIIEMQSVLTND